MKNRIAKVKKASTGEPVGWAELDRHGIPLELFDAQGEALPWPSGGVTVDGPTSNEEIELPDDSMLELVRKPRRREAILRYLSRPTDDPSDTERHRVKIENAIELLQDLLDRVRDMEQKLKWTRGKLSESVVVDITFGAEIVP